MNIKIVKMRRSHLDSLFELGRRQWGNDEPWLTRDYLVSSFEQNGLHYTAMSDNKIIGGINMVYEDIARNWIRYLIVDKEYQRNGIGSRLLQTIIAHLRNGENVFIDTGISYRSAIKFYLKNGFKNKGRVADLYKKEDAFIFKKEIKQAKK